MREISLHLLDLFQNSVAAGADLIEIEIRSETKDNTLRISLKDNGKGMDSFELEKCTDPFYTSRTTRNVGLGIPFLKMSAELTGGHFKISSQPGIGTDIQVLFNSDHIDSIPLGDINSTMLILISQANEYNLTYKRITDNKLFEIDTKVMRECLEDVSMSSPEVTQFLRDYLDENSPDKWQENN